MARLSRGISHKTSLPTLTLLSHTAEIIRRPCNQTLSQSRRTPSSPLQDRSSTPPQHYDRTCFRTPILSYLSTQRRYSSLFMTVARTTASTTRHLQWRSRHLLEQSRQDGRKTLWAHGRYHTPLALSDRARPRGSCAFWIFEVHKLSVCISLPLTPILVTSRLLSPRTSLFPLHPCTRTPGHLSVFDHRSPTPHRGESDL